MDTRASISFRTRQKKLTDDRIRIEIPNSEKLIYILCDASTYGIGAALLYKKPVWENRINIGKLSLFSTTELKLSTILIERSEIIYEFLEYNFFIQESQHSIIL